MSELFLEHCNEVLDDWDAVRDDGWNNHGDSMRWRPDQAPRTAIGHVYQAPRTAAAPLVDGEALMAMSRVLDRVVHHGLRGRTLTYSGFDMHRLLNAYTEAILPTAEGFQRVRSFFFGPPDPEQPSRDQFSQPVSVRRPGSRYDYPARLRARRRRRR